MDLSIYYRSGHVRARIRRCVSASRRSPVGQYQSGVFNGIREKVELQILRRSDVNRSEAYPAQETRHRDGQRERRNRK